jgi:hypothetical protein
MDWHVYKKVTHYADIPMFILMVPDPYPLANREPPFSSPLSQLRGVHLHQEAVVHIINKSYNLNDLIFLGLREAYTFMRAGM